MCEYSNTNSTNTHVGPWFIVSPEGLLQSAQNLTVEISGWVQSLAHNGQPSIWWQCSIMLNFGFREQVLLLCATDSPKHRSRFNPQQEWHENSIQLCWLFFNPSVSVSVTTIACKTKDPGHSARSVSWRLQPNVHPFSECKLIHYIYIMKKEDLNTVDRCLDTVEVWNNFPMSQRK